MKISLIPLIKIKSALILIILANILVFASDVPDVELKGKVQSIEFDSEDSSTISFNIVIQMEFINKSIRPILLSKREPWLNSKFISSSINNLSNKKYMYSFTAYPSNDVSSKWEEYRKELDKNAPPQEHIRSVLPNETWQFNVDSVIEINKIAAKGGGSWNEVDWSGIKSSPELWLQLEINLWFSNIEPVASRKEKKFGKKLREQWEKYGYLWLDDIVSQPIQLDLKPAITKIEQK